PRQSAGPRQVRSLPIPQRSIHPRRHRRDPSRPRRPPPRPPICPPKPGKRVHSVRPAGAARARSAARRSGCGESSSRIAIGLDWFLGPPNPVNPGLEYLQKENQEMAQSAAKRAKSALPKSATIVIKNQLPNPSGEVEVTPHGGRIIFENKDKK